MGRYGKEQPVKEPSPSQSRMTFTPAMRLTERRDFERLKQRGERLIQGCLIANWALSEDQRSSRAGFITSRRIGGAVERNRARRLLRESFRLHQHELVQPVDLAIIARRSIVGKRLADVERDYVRALRKARLMKAES